MHAKAHALSDAHLVRRDVFHPAHEAEAFVAVDQRNIERLALDGMHDRGGVDRSQPLADAPFQPVAAGEGTKHARVEDRTSRLGAELIGKLAAVEMIEIGLERSVLLARHGVSESRRLQPNRSCSVAATAQSTVLDPSHPPLVVRHSDSDCLKLGAINKLPTPPRGGGWPP